MSPGKEPVQATIIIRNGRIQQVASELEMPADVQVVDATGKMVYPGFIDSYSERTVDGFDATAGYWNDNVTPQRNALYGFKSTASTSSQWRKLGFAARLVAPKSGQIKGTSALITCGPEETAELIIQPQVGLHVSLSTRRRGRSEDYPSSPMGAVALVRQAFYDADWYDKAWKSASANAKVERPANNLALASLSEWTDSGRPVIVDSSNERYFARADRLGNEFGLPIIVRGSGREYRRLQDVIGTGRAVIVPLNFPKAPAVGTPADAVDASLLSLMHWDLAPENPGRLAMAGVRIALTTEGLEKVSEFWTQVRKAVKRGLPEEAALAALTTNPAEMFDVADQMGTIQSGKAAHLVIASGNLFTDKKAKIEETWISGNRHRIVDERDANLNGVWQLALSGSADDVEPEGNAERLLMLRISGNPPKLKGSIAIADEAKDKRTKVDKLQQRGSRLSLLFDGEKLDREGYVNISLVVVEPIADGTILLGRGTWPDGSIFQCSATRTGELEKEDEKADDGEEEEEDPSVEEAVADVAATKKEKTIVDSPQSDDEPPLEDDPETNGDSTERREDSDDETGNQENEANESENDADDGTKEDDGEQDENALFDVNYPLRRVRSRSTATTI